MKRQLLIWAMALLIGSPAMAATLSPIAPTPTSTPVPTQTSTVPPTIKAIGTGATVSRISPGVTLALSGRPSGEYRVTSTQSITWDGSKVTASTRYVGSKVIQEVYKY